MDLKQLVRSVAPPEGRGRWIKCSKLMKQRGYNLSVKECRHLFGKNERTQRRKAGAWSFEEDRRLREVALAHDGHPHRWAICAESVGTGRLAKQCRERFLNQLDPTLKPVGTWTSREDHELTRLFAATQGRWAEIAQGLDGRSANHCKNRWKILPLAEPTVVVL